MNASYFHLGKAKDDSIVETLAGDEWQEDPKWHVRKVLRPSAEFDAGFAGVTDKRGAVYGHPLDDFSRITAIQAALPDYGNPALQHCANMIAVKLARLGQTNSHVDSLVDIAGYARTWAMILDRLA